MLLVFGIGSNLHLCSGAGLWGVRDYRGSLTPHLFTLPKGCAVPNFMG